ncbi:P-loop NTPase fold protein [Nostoc sp.]|uniref:P-loop NTPase fold protein n=1 Tax=Nostoc sp. TaxID=1180 RepID=UPI002FFC08A0
MNTLEQNFDTRNFSDRLTGSGFTLLKGDCICEDGCKDSRKSQKTGLIFCRKAVNPTDYIYRGQDRHGFGMWQAVEDAQAFSSQASEEREQKKRESLEVQERRRREQIQRQMSDFERNRWYQQLLDQLVLTDADREKLLARGFTREQIITDGYKSVTAWQKIGKRFPPNLPGILTNGILNVPGDGILCPIRNLDGLVIGCQVRLHDGTQGRYRWLTSITKKNPEGVTSHLNGELPVGVFEPNDFLGNSIWVTEGTSIKPSLARYRLGVPVVGAASGRFDSSRETVKASIEYLATKYQTNILTFAIDAGDVVNRSGVPERWQQQFEFLSSLGYQCYFAWWGQVTKQHHDIDELKDYSQIKIISPSEFLSIVQGHKVEKPKTEKSKSTKSDEWKETYELERKIRARFNFTRNAEIAIKDGFLPRIKLDAIQPGTIGIRGDWGIGKSFLISSWCKEWKHKIIQVAHLNHCLVIPLLNLIAFIIMN